LVRVESCTLGGGDELDDGLVPEQAAIGLITAVTQASASRGFLQCMIVFLGGVSGIAVPRTRVLYVQYLVC
jgi:hypothetical protein